MFNHNGKGIIYYTDSQLDEKYAQPVRDQLKSIGLPIVGSFLKPPYKQVFDLDIYLPYERGYLTMFKQILACLKASKSDIIFFCEHDVLYPKEHFDFTPSPEKFYYDINWWKVRSDGLAVHWDAAQVSGLVCYRDLAISWYEERVATYDSEDFDRKFEPTVEDEYETFKAAVPHIDIRHNKNLTFNKWKLDHFRKKETAVNFETSTIDKIPGWENLQLYLK